tara:strand:+ start:198 stop:449 length:252 start_codon:yes stop_codon:yes gene_type:complete
MNSLKGLLVFFASNSIYAASVDAMAKKGEKTLTSWFFSTMVLSVIVVAWKMRKGKPEAKEKLEMIFESAFLVAVASAVAVVFK